ncbi:MAG: hypothetical protein WC539_05715 [Nitrospirota bacterium]
MKYYTYKGRRKNQYFTIPWLTELTDLNLPNEISQSHFRLFEIVDIESDAQLLQEGKQIIEAIGKNGFAIHRTAFWFEKIKQREEEHVSVQPANNTDSVQHENLLESNTADTDKLKTDDSIEAEDSAEHESFIEIKNTIPTPERNYRILNQILGEVKTLPNSLTIEAKGFKPLHIKKQGNRISLLQSRGKVPDPLAEITISPDLKKAIALSYQDASGIIISSRSEMNQMLADWLEDLRTQGFARK